MKAKRNVYLDLKPLEEARAQFLERFAWDKMLGTEAVATTDAVGRVLAESVAAVWSSPTYHGAAMDGIAVCAEATYGASEAEPLDLRVDDSAIFVNTGDLMPPDTDAVIMIEQVQELGDGRLRIEAPAFPWQHVRKVGEDIVATELLFTRNHLVRPHCLGALLAGGVLSVSVKKRPRVLIIPTGMEIVDPASLAGCSPEPGTIVESNGTVLGKLVEEHGGEYSLRARIGDNVELISRAIGEATDGDFDMVLIIGGSSAGARDLTRASVERAGEVLVHGVTVMPGKPTLLGAVNEKPVVGIPGYPVSAFVAFDEMVAPALAAMLGSEPSRRPTAEVTPTRKIASKLGLEELVRVRLGEVGGRVVATPLPRGAGTITSITKADAIIRVPAQLEGIHPDQPVSAELLRPMASVARNLVAVGSHDICLDLLADLLRCGHSEVSLSSSHVGSLAGIMAIKNGVCHLAGSHLLDPDDGSYNTSYVKRYLPGRKLRLVHLVEREQGLIVAKGNPKQLGGVGDLVRDDVRFVNRQGGSGTRVLLDYELGKRGLHPSAITGYAHEEYTHMAVAVAVKSGVADAGLGILAAARALELDFISVIAEDYGSIIPDELYAEPRIRALLRVIRSPDLTARIQALGGYNTDRTGGTEQGHSPVS